MDHIVLEMSVPQICEEIAEDVQFAQEDTFKHDFRSGARISMCLQSMWNSWKLCSFFWCHRSRQISRSDSASASGAHSRARADSGIPCATYPIEKHGGVSASEQTLAFLVPQINAQIVERFYLGSAPTSTLCSTQWHSSCQRSKRKHRLCVRLFLWCASTSTSWTRASQEVPSSEAAKKVNSAVTRTRSCLKRRWHGHPNRRMSSSRRHGEAGEFIRKEDLLWACLEGSGLPLQRALCFRVFLFFFCTVVTFPCW